MPAAAGSPDEHTAGPVTVAPPRQADRVTDELRAAILGLDLLPGSLLGTRPGTEVRGFPDAGPGGAGPGHGAYRRLDGAGGSG